MWSKCPFDSLGLFCYNYYYILYMCIRDDISYSSNLGIIHVRKPPTFFVSLCTPYPLIFLPSPIYMVSEIKRYIPNFFLLYDSFIWLHLRNLSHVKIFTGFSVQFFKFTCIFSSNFEVCLYPHLKQPCAHGSHFPIHKHLPNHHLPSNSTLVDNFLWRTWAIQPPSLN